MRQAGGGGGGGVEGHDVDQNIDICAGVEKLNKLSEDTTFGRVTFWSPAICLSVRPTFVRPSVCLSVNLHLLLIFLNASSPESLGLS